MTAFGTVEEADVEGNDLSEAMQNALEEFGVAGNDEGHITIDITGEA